MDHNPHMRDPIAHAAHLLREAAQELKACHTLQDSSVWTQEPDAKAAYDEHIAAAEALEQFTASFGAGGVSGSLMGASLAASAGGWAGGVAQGCRRGARVLQFGFHQRQVCCARWVSMR